MQVCLTCMPAGTGLKMADDAKGRLRRTIIYDTV